jgi:hypothetical protein
MPKHCRSSDGSSSGRLVRRGEQVRLRRGREEQRRRRNHDGQTGPSQRRVAVAGSRFSSGIASSVRVGVQHNAASVGSWLKRGGTSSVQAPATVRISSRAASRRVVEDLDVRRRGPRRIEMELARVRVALEARPVRAGDGRNRPPAGNVCAAGASRDLDDLPRRPDRARSAAGARWIRRRRAWCVSRRGLRKAARRRRRSACRLKRHGHRRDAVEPQRRAAARS